MKAGVLVLALMPAIAAVAQDEAAKKPEPAPRVSEVKLFERTLTVTVPANWTDTDERGSYSLESWTHAKGWTSPDIRGFAVHLYGVEESGLTADALAKRWLAAAGRATVEIKIEAAGRSRQMSGTDVEIELNENGAISWYWLRAIISARDRLFVLVAEASPLVGTYGRLAEIGPVASKILDSFVNAAGKDPWRRDPRVRITRDKLMATFAAPAGWTYARGFGPLAFEWTGPNGQEMLLDFPMSMRLQGGGIEFRMKPDSLFEMMVRMADGMKRNGRLVSRETLKGPDRAEDVILVLKGDEPKAAQAEEDEGEPKRPPSPPTWQHQRIILHGDTIVQLMATHPLASVDAMPPEPAQRAVKAAFDSLKLQDS